MEAMDLFERYLEAVRKLLPWRRQSDIIAELRANLEAQREEREAELRRPLTEGEMIDWLKELGPPLEMASRYQPPRYLIGPTIFPMYWKILRLVMLCVSAGYAVSIIARLIVESHGSEWVAGQIFQYPGILIMVAGWVTAVFAALQFISQHYPEKCPEFVAPKPNWSPANLPPVEKQPPSGGKVRTFAAAVAEWVVQFVLLVWMLLIPRYPFLLMGPGAAILEHSPIRLSPVSVWWFWALIGFNIVQLIWQGLNLLFSNWRIRSRAQQLATKAMGLVPTLILLVAPGHIYLEANPTEASRMPASVDLAAVNHWLFFGVIAITCLVVFQLAQDIWKSNRGSRQLPANGGSVRPV